MGSQVLGIQPIIINNAPNSLARGRRPKAYVCAADGCGLEATSKTALMRCAGPCKLEDKPSYCSKECQRRVSIVPYSLSTCADGVVAIL